MNATKTKTSRHYAAAGAGIVLGLSSVATAKDQERPGPPPEAIAACEDLEEGDECTVEFRGRSLTGTCTPGPRNDDPLLCMPEGGPPPGVPPREPPVAEDR